ncbi:FmdB family zinc ribbon protein [Natrialbaceae archaeon GCM10025810]
MTRYEFTCPECAQEIEVNEAMREATLAHGCPVCGADVSPADFAQQTPTN